MRNVWKAGIAVGVALVLSGCPRATSVTGLVNTGFGTLGSASVQVGDSLSPEKTYYVADGASITVTYDNNKSCTFRGPIEFIPGADGSICEKKDNNDKKQDKDDQQQEQRQQDQPSSQQPDASNSGISAPEVAPSTVPDYSGINAPAVTPTSVPEFSGGGGGGGGLGGPPVIATAVPTYSRIMSVVTNPILTNTLAAIGAISVANEIRKETDGNGDEPVSK